MFTSQADKVLTCADCGQEFTFTGSEAAFYADRGFTEPRRCPSCRAARKASRGDSQGGGYSSGSSDRGGYSSRGPSSGGYDRAPREMFAATCSSCGRATEVPFKPTGSKPVYCRDCFATQRRSY